MNLKKVMILGVAIACSGSLHVSARELSTDSSAGKKSGSAALDCVIDVEAYKASYKDLQAAFGDDDSAYIEHYLTYGVYEGRKKGVLFDPLAYAEAYSDIKAAYGGDVMAIVEHYVNYGMAEERTLGTANGYKDIATAEVNGVPAIDVQRRGNKTASSKTGSYSAAATAAYDEEAYAGTTGSAGTASAAINYSYAGGSSSQGNSQSNSAAAVNNNRYYHHTTSIYTDDESTLLRVEYYNDNNKLFEYSSIENYNKETGSYTETIYRYDDEKNEEIVVRTNTYENGELVSSK